MKVVQETAKKIGFYTALSMLIGSVIGIGIFLKNGGIFAINGNNGIGIILSWTIGAIIALTAAISFAEVGTSIKSRAGLAGWVEKFWGKRIGYFVKMTQPIFYMGLMMPILCFFSAESIFLIFDANQKFKIHYGFIVLAAFCLLILFLLFNFFSLKYSGKFSFLTTILKFVPLFTIIIWGIVFAIQNQSVGLFNVDGTGENIIISPLNAASILASLPSVLFAFDSFANVGNLSLDIKKPEKNVPLVIIVGMISCSIFYLLVTISQIFFMEGNSLKIFNDIIQNNPNANIALSIILNVFITISIIGVLNSFSCTSIRSFNSLVDDKLIFCHSQVDRISKKIFKRFDSDLKSGLILSFIIDGFWFWILGILSIANGSLGGDVYIDGVSNYPTLFFFGIYGFVILGGLINRYTKKIDVQKQKTFLFAAPIAIAGSLLVFGYQFFYEFLYRAIENPNEKLSWGLFFSNDVVVYRWEGMIFFFSFLIIFFMIPILNYFLYKVFNKNKKNNFVINKE